MGTGNYRDADTCRLAGRRVAGRLRAAYIGSRYRTLLSLAALLCAALLASGCGQLLGGPHGGDEGSGEAQALREENERLEEDNERLRQENEDLLAEAGSPEDGEDSSEEAASEETSQEENLSEEADTEEAPEPEQGGAELAVAQEGDVEGESVPEIMPEDFPLPAGSLIEYTDEDFYNFSLQLVLDSELEPVTSFYEDQMASAGWEEVDRTEYETDGLAGVDLMYERGTFTYKDSGTQSNREDATITIQEIEPSGTAARILWTDNETFDREYTG